MRNISLQIDGKDVWLGDDVAITIEMHSPLWNEAGSLSYEFDIPVSPNRHIFGSADQGHGNSVYDAVDGKPFRLYVMGIPFMSGKVELDDEVELDRGADFVSVSLVSGKQEFDDMIEGLSARDLRQAHRIDIGSALHHATDHYHVYMYNERSLLHGTRDFMDIPAGLSLRMEDKSGNPTVNVSLPYPAKEYANVRIAFQKYELDGNGGKVTGDKREYTVLDAYRGNSGVSFYMMYFLDCLFAHIGVPVLRNDLLAEDELCRVLLMNLGCDYEVEADGSSGGTIQDNRYNATGYKVRNRDTNYQYDWMNFTFKYGKPSTVGRYYPGIDSPLYDGGANQLVIDETWDFYGGRAYLTSKNFPAEDVSTMLDAFQNAFGFRVMYDSRNGTARMVLLRNVLRQTEWTELGGETVAKVKVESALDGFRLKYSSDDGNVESGEILDYGADTSYTYRDYTRVVNSGYAGAKAAVSATNRNTYYNPETGNAYRVRIDRDSQYEQGKSLRYIFQPSLFEVGMFGRAEYGDCSVEDRTEEKVIGFTPVIMNDVAGDSRNGKAEQVFALFLDGIGEQMVAKGDDIYDTVSEVFEQDVDDPVPSCTSVQLCLNLNFEQSEPYDHSVSDRDPVTGYDLGFSVSVMRGPGNNAGVTDYNHDYDGEGNFMWNTTPGNYAVHSDMCDDYGRIFDYNGRDGGRLMGTFSSAEIAAFISRYFPLAAGDLSDKRNMHTVAEYVARGWNDLEGRDGAEKVPYHLSVWEVSAPDTFSKDKSYSKGSLCAYAGKVYEFTTGHNKEAWNVSHVVLKHDSRQYVLTKDEWSGEFGGYVNYIQTPDGSREYVMRSLSKYENGEQLDVMKCEMGWGGDNSKRHIFIGHYDSRSEALRMAALLMELGKGCFSDTGSAFVNIEVDEHGYRIHEEMDREKAESAMHRFFPNANANLTRALLGAYADEDYLLGIARMAAPAGRGDVWVLYTRVGASGMVTESYISTYLKRCEESFAREGTAMGADTYGLFIGEYSSDVKASSYRELFRSLADVYFSGNTGYIDVTVFDESLDGDYGNGIGTDPSRRFSLKLRAEKEDYAIVSPELKRRGLFDRFYSEYSYWVTHRKMQRFQRRMEIADVVNIDFTRKYRIDEYEGFINKLSVTVDSDGMGDVEIELYYI